MGASEKYGGGHVCVGERGGGGVTGPGAVASSEPTSHRPASKSANGICRMGFCITERKRNGVQKKGVPCTSEEDVHSFISACPQLLLG